MRTLTIFTALVFVLASISLNAQQGGYDLQFDGTNDYVDCGAGSSFNITGTTITIEAWINTSKIDQSWQAIGGKQNAPSGAYSLIIEGSNKKPAFWLATTSSAWSSKVIANTVLQQNQWYHIAGTYDGSNARIYVNGKLENSAALNGNIVNLSTVPVYIGRNSNVYFNGMIDEFRIWNISRTEAEIKANMFKEIGTHANLKAYYQMSDGSGTSLTDNSLNGNTGTLTNGTIWKVSGCLAGSRQALDFDGTNDYVDIGNNASLKLTTAVTVEAWIYPTYLDPTSVANNVIFERSGNNGYGYQLRCGGNGNIDFIVGGTGWSAYSAYAPDNTLSLNKWFHVAGTYDKNASKIILYVNGIEVATGSTNIIMETSGTSFNANIARSAQFTSRIFKGLLDEVRVWNYARSENEIRQNCLNTLAVNETGLVGYWRFDQNDGTTLYDMTTNGNNGTLTNMDATTDWVSSTAFNTWLGGESADWSNAANWSNGVPVTAQSAGIYNWNTALPNVTTLPILPATIDVNNLLVPSGVTSPSNVNLTADGSVFLGSSLSLSSSPLNTAGNLIIENDKTLTIPASGQLTVRRTLTNSAGNSGLVIESGGSLIHSTAGVSATAKRDITAWTDIYHGWHFLCSPVANQAISPSFVDITLNPMSANVDLYKWREPENNWINIKNSSNIYNQGTGSTNWSNSLNPTFETGIGYLIAYGNNQTKEFAGSLNVANVEITGLTNTSGNTKKGWHLLGNPFSSAISWTQGSWVKTNIGSAPQIWNENNASYKVLSGEGIIPPLNGFMVYTTGSGVLTIPADSRRHSDSSWYKNSASVNEIVLTARDLQGNTAQETIIGFNPEATENFDLEYDSYFLAGFAPKFYSISNNEFFALNTLPGNDPEIIIPFGFEKNNANHFKIELTESIEGKTLFLIDLKENTEHNLSMNPAYSFVSASGDDPQRFLLKMGTVGIDKDLSQTFQKAWIFNNYLYISNIDSEIIYSLFDLSGRLLQSLKLSGTGLKTIPLNEKTGFYLVKLQNRESTTILKTFVK